MLPGFKYFLNRQQLKGEGGVSAGVKAAVNNQNYFERLGQDFANDAKLTWGLFKGSFEQIFTRFTFEILQTAIGYVTNIGANLFTSIDDVSYYGGATVSRTRLGNWGAFTLGNFILGGSDISADPKNSLFQHEYGHYLQSQESGPIYLFRYAIPSLISASKTEEKHPNHNHNFFWTELDANQRAVRYFERKVSDFDIDNDWDIDRHPLPGYHSYDYPGPVIIDNSKKNIYYKPTVYPKMDLHQNKKLLNNHYLAL